MYYLGTKVECTGIVASEKKQKQIIFEELDNASKLEDKSEKKKKY